MGFGSLLGNERLKENLRAGLQRGRVSHFYLICGPAGSGKKTLARHLAAASLCTGEEKPCLSCPACRKVMADTHPDFITVTDPEHKNVAVKIVRQIRDEMFIRPNEGQRKIYLFPQDLGTEGQNALLKILEEPPSYGVFILLSDNPEKLLPTVRSRCTELTMQALDEKVLDRVLSADFPEADSASRQAAIARSGGYLGQARQILSSGSVTSPQTERFLQAYAARDQLELTRLLVSMEKWERDRFVPELEQWLQALQSTLIRHSGGTAVVPAVRIDGSRSARELNHGIRVLQKAIAYAQGNVSVAALCGQLVWQLR